MKSHTLLIYLLLVIPLFIGCSPFSPPPQLKAPIQRERIFSRPFDEIWKGAMQIVARSDYRIQVADKSSGVIAFILDLSAGDIKEFAADSPSFGFSYSGGQAMVKLLIESLEEGKKAKVFINAKLRGILSGGLLMGASTASIEDLVSNGKFEEQLFNKISITLGEKDFKILETPLPPQRK